MDYDIFCQALARLRGDVSFVGCRMNGKKRKDADRDCSEPMNRTPLQVPKVYPVKKGDWGVHDESNMSAMME